MIFTVILCLAGCGGSSFVSRQLDVAESLMENRPDSALIVLNFIDISDLSGKREKARYALLKSMALDKNYIDTTTFDVLQPAIDYFLEEGTLDEKLCTYYYQGRIFQNKNERDSALHSFMRGLDIADACNDSLIIARMLVAQGGLYKDFYDYVGALENYLKAANIYRQKSHEYLEFSSLTYALNCLNILNEQERADSVIKLLVRFDNLDKNQQHLLHNLRISYIVKFGNKQSLKNLVETMNGSLSNDVNGILNIARAYNRLGDNEEAIRYLNYLDEIGASYDTLKYLSIRYPILEDLKKQEEALAVYKDFVERLETINSAKFEQKSRSMEEKYQLELQAEREAEKIKKLIWICIVGFVFLVMVIIIGTLQMRRNKIKKDLAIQKARTAELENESLKAENELTLQKARTAELENENLKTEKEKLTLENRNLQLERDNKALEAENLAHRVAELESESDNLRELLQSQDEMPEEVRKAIKTRIEMLNSYLASQISDHKEFEKAYDTWVSELTANTQEFMDSNRLAFQASHPAFIKYFEDHGLTESEINYVCLYAIGLRGKDVGNYMRKRSHVNISSTIRKKLGIDKHDTNIGIYVRKLLKGL